MEIITSFDWNMLSRQDIELAEDILGELRYPDLTISPDGSPYIYRWHVLRSTPEHGGTYFHIQVADDPERPLHDHPWDNMSNILAGGYTEILCMTKDEPTAANTGSYHRKPGDVVYRKANWSHRLLLPLEIPYTMTLFMMGPRVRDWGFWYPDGWVSHKDVTAIIDGQSVHIGKAMA